MCSGFEGEPNPDLPVDCPILLPHPSRSIKSGSIQRGALDHMSEVQVLAEQHQQASRSMSFFQAYDPCGQ